MLIWRGALSLVLLKLYWRRWFDINNSWRQIQTKPVTNMILFYLVSWFAACTGFRGSIVGTRVLYKGSLLSRYQACGFLPGTSSTHAVFWSVIIPIFSHCYRRISNENYTLSMAAVYCFCCAIIAAGKPVARCQAEPDFDGTAYSVSLCVFTCECHMRLKA